MHWTPTKTKPNNLHLLPITKRPLLQDSMLTGGNSPNLVDLIEREVPLAHSLIKKVSQNQQITP